MLSGSHSAAGVAVLFKLFKTPNRAFSEVWLSAIALLRNSVFFFLRAKLPAKAAFSLAILTAVARIPLLMA